MPKSICRLTRDLFKQETRTDQQILSHERHLEGRRAGYRAGRLEEAERERQEAILRRVYHPPADGTGIWG